MANGDADKRRLDLQPVVELLKSLGVIFGSFGSLALLFFWIGNAIIVARLRAYNLYGVVRYTDEYVNEAGYQFFQDIFTFFQDWKLLLLFLVATALVIALIPVGPHTRGEPKDLTGKPWILGILFGIVAKIRAYAIHYGLFLLLALSASVSLTSNLGVENLSKAIDDHEERLQKIRDYIENKPLVFKAIPKAEVGANPSQKLFYDGLSSGEKPTLYWLSQSLSEFYKDTPGSGGLSNWIERFQTDFNIKERPHFDSDEEVEKSLTGQVLLDLRLSNKLDKRLRDSLRYSSTTLRQLLNAHRDSGEDYLSLVVIPANYERVNDAILETKVLWKKVLRYFKPEDEGFSKLMSDLVDIEPLRFGSFLLSFSFWVLLGMGAYILLNVTNLLKFKHWEAGYFFLMVLLFITIVVTLPTAYGRYKFEFKIHKLNEIIFSEDDPNNPIKRKVRELWDKNASLYLLGPTKGKEEVIVGAIRSEQDPLGGGLQILVLDRASYKFMLLEPAGIHDNQTIIRMLRANPKGPS